MKKLRVYLVDDDEDDRAIFCEVLTELNTHADCITFTNGQDVLENLESATKLPDFIFLDLNLPRLNGRQCLQKIKQHKALSGIPVIMYSTSKLPADIEDTKILGADYFITKPTDLNKLKTELEFVLRKRQVKK